MTLWTIYEHPTMLWFVGLCFVVCGAQQSGEVTVTYQYLDGKLISF